MKNPTAERVLQKTFDHLEQVLDEPEVTERKKPKGKDECVVVRQKNGPEKSRFQSRKRHQHKKDGQEIYHG